MPIPAPLLLRNAAGVVRPSPLMNTILLDSAALIGDQAMLSNFANCRPFPSPKQRLGRGHEELYCVLLLEPSKPDSRPIFEPRYTSDGREPIASGL